MTVFLVVVVASALVGCAHQPEPAAMGAPGFLMALVHGAIAPVALLAGIFSDVRVYAFPNSGLGYDFGFLIGLSLWGSGGAYAASELD